MNRAMRRAGLSSARVVVADEVCVGCGAPICPDCGDETAECSCCGRFNCERCGHYVVNLVQNH